MWPLRHERAGTLFSIERYAKSAKTALCRLCGVVCWMLKITLARKRKSPLTSSPTHGSADSQWCRHICILISLHSSCHCCMYYGYSFISIPIKRDSEYSDTDPEGWCQAVSIDNIFLTKISATCTSGTCIKSNGESIKKAISYSDS